MFEPHEETAEKNRDADQFRFHIDDLANFTFSKGDKTWLQVDDNDGDDGDGYDEHSDDDDNDDGDDGDDDAAAAAADDDDGHD